MEFYVYFVIVVVILVSLATSLIISKLPRGKSFEEVLSEKKKLAEKLYGTSGKKSQKSKKQQQPGNVNKKGGKEKVKPIKEESSDDVVDNSGQKTSSPKAHVEFVDSEVTTDTDSPRAKKQQQQVAAKKSGKKNGGGKASGTGILINKSETSVAKSSAAEPMNHFEQTHPKDEAELLRATNKDESAENGRSQVSSKNDKNAANRDSKKGKNLKVQLSAEKDEKPAVAPVEEKVAVKKVAEVKEKPQKKAAPTAGKKQESTGLAVQKIIAETEEIGVNFLIPLLSKAELSRSEIQIIIEYLLNKQSDTITANHCEWTEGKSDVVQKLKKQIELKEKALQDEQEASAGIQARLRELRAEINLEKSQYNANLKAYIEEIAQKSKDLQSISADYQQLNEKYLSEKQSMTVQLQQIQAKLIQEKKTNSQETLQQIQQLTDANNVLNSEVMTKSKLISDVNEQFQKFANEKHQVIETIKKDYDSKLAEYEMIIRKKEEQQLYMEQDLQKIRSIAERDADALRVKRFELDQYKTQLAEMSKNNQDMGKVEIRNLQNALDSCQTDLARSRNEVSEYKHKSEDLEAQVGELKRQMSIWSTKIHEQTVQMSEMDVVLTGCKSSLAEKDAKLTETETKMRGFGDEKERLEKEIEDLKSKNNDTTENQRGSAKDTEDRTRSVIVKSFPNLPAGPAQFDQWIDHVCDYLRSSSSSTTTTHSTSATSIPHSAINSSTSNSFRNNSDCDAGAVDDDEDVGVTKVTTNNHSSRSEEDGGDGLSDKLDTLLLQNAQLQRTVDEYKTLLADTEGVLNNVEMKAKEQDAYWRKVVETKDVELQGLKLSSTCQPINNTE